MKTNIINQETIFEILIQLIRISKKFNEIENLNIDIGNGEKLYPSEIHIIVAVGNNKGKTVTELSKIFGITKGAVSQVVNKLALKDFINKERNKEYGKEIILSLTDKGHKAFEIQNEFHKNMEIEFIKYLENYTSDEITAYLEIMGKIEEYVDEFFKKGMIK